MTQPNDSLRLLEADLRALSLQASRVEGGVFGGLFSSGSGPLDPDVRDAAEHALARLRAGAAFHVASEPSEEKASTSATSATAPALRAALSACASPRPDVALAGLRCAQRLVAIGAALASDDLCALADALGADEADETEDDDERFDAVATRKAQTLLQVLELDACFRDERVARRVLAACFRVLAAANARALRETHESASRRIVAAEAAAFRACERAFAAASFGDDDAEEDDGNDDSRFGGTTRGSIQTTIQNSREAFVTTERRVAFDVFCELCDAAAGDAAAGDADRTPPRFAFDALTRALLVEPRARNAIRGFETAGGAFGVAAIKTRLCAALVTKTFSMASMASPGRSARRRDSAAFVAEGRAATRCAGAFLRFAAPRRREQRESRDGVAERAERVADSPRAESSPSRAESSFFAFLSPSRLGRDAEEEDEPQRSPNPRESVEFARRTESSAPNDENEKESDFDFVDPFAAERLMFLGSFASSLEGEMAPWRRSAALDVLRTVAGDPELLRHARGDGAGTGNASDAFGEVTDILARVAEAGVSVPRGDGDDAFRDGDTSEVTDADDAVPLRVASAFRDAANAARNASKFREPEDSDETGHVAHAVFLALDGVLATCSSLETLADESVFLKDESYKTDVRLMVERAWVSLESCLRTAFRRVPGEAATLELSRAYQALTRAAAAAGAREAVDACLASLCAFSVSDSDSFQMRERDHESKSAHAFRALLNAAQSLVAADGGLGFRGWFAVLETTRLVEARRALAGSRERTMTTTETNSDDATVDALLASAAALVASSAALRDEQSADALEAARGSSARELEELSGRFQSISAPKATNVPADARAVPVRSDLRALARFVDAVLLRVRGETLDAPSRATAAAAAWRTLEAHFRDALESAAQSPEIARRACAHLERAVVGALEAIAAGKRFDDASLDAAGVLAPLARAKARARGLTARLQAVEAISALVRERGDLLAAAAGWAAAFDALRAGDFVETQNLAGRLGAERETSFLVERHTKTGRSGRRRKDDAAVVVAGWSAAAFVVSDALPLLSLGAPGNEEARDGARDGAVALALARVVPLLSSYASQTDDTRVSLSAVNAMWNACDVFAKTSSEDTGFRDGGDREGTSTRRENSLDALLLRAFEALAAAGVDRSRPDVRHSGVNTLANVLAARGAALSPAAWRDATLGVFFPLVFEIRARAAAAGDERVDVSMVSALASNGSSSRRARGGVGGVGGATTAASVASSTEVSPQTDPSRDPSRDPPDSTPVLLVHHSRNTAAKQWDETLSVAITAVGELARKRAARLLAPETRDAFVGRLDSVWTRTCAFAAECVTSASQETATAALRAARLAATRFASVSVDASVGDASVRAAARAAFKAATRGVYETATRLATRDPEKKKKVTAKTRLELAKTLAQVFAAVPNSAFDFDDVAVVVSVADALARAPEPWPEWFEEEEGSSLIAKEKTSTSKALRLLGSGYAASQTQRACFDALAALVPNVTDACVDAGTYVTVLFCFLAYVDGSNVSSGPDASNPDATEIVPTQPSSIGTAENATCAALACDAFAKLAACPGLPGDDLACAFAGAVSAFARAIRHAIRHETSGREEGRSEEAFETRVAATRAFHATLDRGVPAAQKYVSAAGGADAVRRSWGVIADTFEASVLNAPSPSAKPPGGTDEGPARRKRRFREEDALRREGLAALRDACARGDSAPEDVIARLVQVLAAGADAEIGHETSSAVRVEEESSSAAASDAATETSVARSFAERAFPSLCLLHLRDLVLSAGAGPGASSAARLAAPALLAKCESSLRRYAAEESLRREGSAEGFESAVSAARAAVAARALASALAPAPGGGPGGGFFFRKETPATILAAAATPERARALRAALEACVEASDAALRDAAGTTLAALSRFQESRA